MIAWPPGPRTIQAHSAWALECADHSLARLLQRAPRTDLHAVLFQAGGITTVIGVRGSEARRRRLQALVAI
jgi:hypothetical protein